MDLTSTKILRFEHYSQIDGNLWMGGTPAQANDHPKFADFRFVICCYPWEHYPIHEHQVQTRVCMYDANQLPDLELVGALADYVNSVRKIGPTLVHCQQGWNRSGIIVALALIRAGMYPSDAIALMREKRSEEVLCNQVFEAWLLTQPGSEKPLV